MRRMLVFAVMASIVSPALAQEESERDRKKNAAALYSEGLRAETEKHINLALALKAQGKETEAVQEISKAYQIDPKDSWVQSNYEKLMPGAKH